MGEPSRFPIGLDDYFRCQSLAWSFESLVYQTSAWKQASCRLLNCCIFTEWCWPRLNTIWRLWETIASESIARIVRHIHTESQHCMNDTDQQMPSKEFNSEHNFIRRADQRRRYQVRISSLLGMIPDRSTWTRTLSASRWGSPATLHTINSVTTTSPWLILSTRQPIVMETINVRNLELAQLNSILWLINRTQVDSEMIVPFSLQLISCHPPDMRCTSLAKVPMHGVVVWWLVIPKVRGTGWWDQSEVFWRRFDADPGEEWLLTPCTVASTSFRICECWIREIDAVLDMTAVAGARKGIFGRHFWKCLSQRTDK